MNPGSVKMECRCPWLPLPHLPFLMVAVSWCGRVEGREVGDSKEKKCAFWPLVTPPPCSHCLFGAKRSQKGEQTGHADPVFVPRMGVSGTFLWHPPSLLGEQLARIRVASPQHGSRRALYSWWEGVLTSQCLWEISPGTLDALVPPSELGVGGCCVTHLLGLESSGGIGGMGSAMKPTRKEAWPCLSRRGTLSGQAHWRFPHPHPVSGTMGASFGGG